MDIIIIKYLYYNYLIYRLILYLKKTHLIHYYIHIIFIQMKKIDKLWKQDLQDKFKN